MTALRATFSKFRTAYLCNISLRVQIKNYCESISRSSYSTEPLGGTTAADDNRHQKHDDNINQNENNHNSTTVVNSGLMSAWNIHRYGENDELLLSSTSHIPAVYDPKDILIKVHSSSVNPIDVLMRGGYGRTAINNMRKLATCQLTQSEFPLTLGRDFSGTVVDTGKDVKKYKPGDEVWGALGVQRPGCHAQYTVASEREISHKPRGLSHNDAASVPYATLTAWAAICTFGRQHNCHNKRFLVTAGSGGVGAYGIQLLKAWGAHVTTTCSPGAVGLCGEFGADEIIDYTATDSLDLLRQCDRFDFILDLVGSIPSRVASTLLLPRSNSKYVTITSPLLRNMDDLGTLAGLGKSSLQFGADFIQCMTGGSMYGWAFFIPDGAALEKVALLFDNKQMWPVIDRVVPFENLPSAYEAMEVGHARGKLVIEHVGYTGDTHGHDTGGQ